MAIIALHSAATGLKALSEQLDVISNNIANANNNGFKASRANFEDLMYQYTQEPGAKNPALDVLPNGIATGYGVRLASTQLDMSQGSVLQQASSPYDICIQGDGFFQVKLAAGQRDGLGYTRTGIFSVNDKGELVTANGGYKIDPPITVPQGATGFTVGPDGQVTCTVNGQTQTLSQIQLARFPNPQGLLQIGSNIYQSTEASGKPTLGTPGTESLGELQQNAVEASNVDPVKELVSLIQTQRTFELNSQSIQAADQMLQQISNLRR
ncbi:MAG TPA: flagellar basal-body rod protein FlgG [Phycisphaerae bacterium]|jgi:flagellar basal-body rod protein FlgG|nr:flagellar basal-body rod protein FlgG [Phycisphaerae bacterium]